MATPGRTTRSGSMAASSKKKTPPSKHSLSESEEKGSSESEKEGSSESEEEGSNLRETLSKYVLIKFRKSLKKFKSL